ncbi:MAG: VCBS repeat-containing protein, partial [bacterium]
MSIKRNITITLLALFLSPLLAACGGDVDEGTSGVGSLGVNTDLGNRTNPAGEELAEDYHPLSKAFRTIAPLSELYFAGLDYNGTTQGLLDDSQADWAELFSEDDGSWAQLALCSGSGDVDGDGYDEIVVLYHVPAEQVVKLKVIDRDGDAYSQRVTTVLTGVEAPSAHVLAQLFPGIANLTLGDIDGDGKDEIAFGLGNQLYLLDDASTGFVVKEQKSYPLGDANELSILRLGFGDFNGDGRDQLFVTHSQFNPDSSQGFVEWHRYDTSLNEESAGGQLTLRVGYDTKVFAIASSAVGDIDGDGLAEVVFYGLTLTSGNYTFVM